MKNDAFKQLIATADWRSLFITELGWNNPQGQTQLPPIEVDGTGYTMTTVAQRNGFQVLSCTVENIPSHSTCRKIDAKLRQQANEYLCIFVLNNTQHHCWVCTTKNNEKRELVMVEYADVAQTDFLYSKTNLLSFGIDEETTIMDVCERVHHAFAVNAEKVTKDFYSGFRKEHKAFAQFITGIAPEKDRQWYTSVMLNRLMFCYFIQKKGFLDNNTDYLGQKLQEVKLRQVNGSFFRSFYKGFLVSLFHDGLNTPKHNLDWELQYGRIPYLNGGMFDIHQLENQYHEIDIADDAFERLFAFFDTWQWHLDTRLTASGKDINPDVLGYIFEQYINDRSAMGAYYTKEDITEYIGKNCILPYLMDRVAESPSSKAAFAPKGEVWQRLQQSGDRYIYNAVKKGYRPDWQQQIPPHIARGIDTTQPNLLERRAEWNTTTSEPFALPTEIWRETVERLQRCDSLMAKIAHGEVVHVNDFITYNLNIRAFVLDLLDHTTDHHLVGNFYHALQQVTILDPTCGSGAFLFAALNILEPLYETCIIRMQEFHAENPHLFKAEMEEIDKKYRSNIQYFIYKSIILRNLYGVDIMIEATEIAKLRLFLKMVAVVEVDPRADNMGLDPLPDVDFNIRCGNSLVGYANKAELEKNMIDGNMFARAEFEEKVNDKMQIVSRAYNTFRNIQFNQSINQQVYKKIKQDLRERLADLNELLNQHLYQSSSSQPKKQWFENTKPFHWLAEFFEIIHEHGGFDVIIGNPPYVEYNKKDSITKKTISECYKISGYKTESCGNLYAFTMERCKSLSKKQSYIGMIVPLSGHSTQRMSPLVTNFYKQFSFRLHLNLSADGNPQKLFEGVKFRLAIFIVSNSSVGNYSSKYIRWTPEERLCLFSNLAHYINDSEYEYGNIISKIPNTIFLSIAKKMINNPIGMYIRKFGYSCLYHNAPVHWMRSHTFVPYFCSEREGEGATTQLKPLYFNNKLQAQTISAILNSSLFFIFWITNSDCYHLNIPEISNFSCPKLDTNVITELSNLTEKLEKDMQDKSSRRVCYYKTTGRVEYDEFHIRLSKPIIDEIDKVLAKHYGFTEEELDFIINYDIKYRMGDELNNLFG